MRNLTNLRLVALALAAVAAAPAAADPRETRPDDPSCSNPSLTTVRVRITGLKNGAGKVRVQAYGPGAVNYLKKGKWVRRVDMPLNGRTSVEVCVPLPAPGRYAFAVRHDANANKSSDWNDGGGFSRNPKLSLTGRPSFAEAAVAVGRGQNRISVVMNYRRGLSVRPIG